MGKIPVQELARMMGVPKQDLVFKLKSIGVRVEGEDAHIDTDAISAILQGKKLPQPREVILRDEQTPEVAPKRTGTPPPAARRLPTNPLRPARPRNVIQRVEPRIKTLPASERPLTSKARPRPVGMSSSTHSGTRIAVVVMGGSWRAGGVSPLF